MSKAEIQARAYELGFRYERDFHGCSQCVIAAIQDALEIGNDCVSKAGSGLAGGAGGCTDGLCGAGVVVLTLTPSVAVFRLAECVGKAGASGLPPPVAQPLEPSLTVAHIRAKDVVEDDQLGRVSPLS